MTHAKRLSLMLLTAAVTAACQAPQLALPADGPGIRVPTGSLTLRIQIPQEPGRRVQYVPVSTTKSVKVTVEGPAQPYNAVVVKANVVLDVNNATQVNVSGIRAGTNLVVKVEAYDGPLSGGNPSGKLLETLYGLVDILDGQDAAATVNWTTTPAGEAIYHLARNGVPERAMATDRTALLGLINDLTGGGALHPVLVNGQRLAGAMLRYTLAQPNAAVVHGYQVPPNGHAVLTGVVAAPAVANNVKVYDLRGTAVTTDLKLTMGDPVSVPDTASTYDFPQIPPGDWWVFVDGTGAETRRNAFYRRVAEGDANAQPTAFLSGNASSYAGTGAAGTGTGAAPQFRDAHQVAIDGAGNLFVADTGNHRVVKIATDGSMTVVAGTGTAGNTGDDGLATSATLRFPEGVAVDAAGNVFIADTGNHLIRVVEASTGFMRRLAGTGTAGYNGEGGALTHQVSGPTQLSLGGVPATLYFHDSGNQRIRRIALNASMITETSLTSLPLTNLTSENTGLAFQSIAGTDYLYYCKFSPPQLVQRTLNGANINQELSVAGGGELIAPFDEGVGGEKVKLGEVKSIACDNAGNVYFGDRWGSGAMHGRVRYANPDKFTEVFTVAGVAGQNALTGPGIGTESPIGVPWGLAITNAAGSSLFVATSGDHRLVRVEP